MEYAERKIPHIRLLENLNFKKSTDEEYKKDDVKYVTLFKATDHFINGNNFIDEGRFSEAENQLKMASALYEKVEFEIELANVNNSLAVLKIRQGQIDEAVFIYNKLIEVSR